MIFILRNVAIQGRITGAIKHPDPTVPVDTACGVNAGWKLPLSPCNSYHPQMASIALYHGFLGVEKWWILSTSYPQKLSTAKPLQINSAIQSTPIFS